MNSKATLRQEGATLFLEGDITFATVAGLYNQLAGKITGSFETLDCSGVGIADSTAVSLLLFCQLERTGGSTPLQLVGINEAINSLIELYDVKVMLFGHGTG